MPSNSWMRTGALALFASVLCACAPGAYPVRDPAPSGLAFSGAPRATTLAVVDARGGADRVFFGGTLAATLTVDNAPVEAVGYLARNLGRELDSRGLDVEVESGGAALPRLDVRAFRIQNHRASGFGPFVSFTWLSADLETAAGKQRLGVFVKRGKVPVWSFDEVIEPTLNEPLSIAVKELATKIADRLQDARSSDNEVSRLVGKLAQRGDASYLDVYALGFTNNPAAIEPLVKLTGDPDEYVRLAAISSLGTLGAADQLDLLKSIHEGTGMWQDRAMALKSIGDLDTPEARAYLAERLKAFEGSGTDKEAAWSMQVIGLYL